MLFNKYQQKLYSYTEYKVWFHPKIKLATEIHLSLMLIVSANFSDPFASFFCSFRQSVKNISNLFNLYMQSNVQQLFLILDVFLIFGSTQTVC